ncbi:MAG: helix-turn-helix domain-containing protein [Tenericutes bacterium]|nr:helix-turn-helix domain-containing protein [Mycoplasmatota bacterium]
MSNSKLCKGKHLRIEEGLIIEYGLDQNYTLKKIAEIVVNCLLFLNKK